MSTMQHHNCESSNQLLMPILILRGMFIINFCIESVKARAGGLGGAHRTLGTCCFCSRGKADASELNHSIVAD